MGCSVLNVLVCRRQRVKVNGREGGVGVAGGGKETLSVRTAGQPRREEPPLRFLISC